MDPLSSFRSHEGRAGVLLDFDGTLSPIVARPELARIRDGARDAIARLVGRYAVVAIVSGRTATSSAILSASRVCGWPRSTGSPRTLRRFQGS